jgi:hypothetical protein
MNLPNTIPSARGKCDLHTQFAGDDACLAPPDPDKGFQIHIGPSDYDDPLQLQAWQLEPGEEMSSCYAFTLPNGSDVTFTDFEFAARTGLRAAFFGFDRAADPAQICSAMHDDNPRLLAQGALFANQLRITRHPIGSDGTIINLRVSANAFGVVAVHAFNVTDRPVLRELWLNLYYAPLGGLPGAP